ncbi:DUF6882 domain-containing protein [Paenibacillus sp. y28]|uniref:DUF6882 domain-containing protein n=1 Tax=Paenibacillus sp. y28 TaxID=3129110 RepID=UPI003016702E
MFSSFFKRKSPWDELFTQHGASSYFKQMVLAGMVENYDWLFDMENGTLSFLDDRQQEIHRFEVQIIGTHSYRDHTWLWSWANEKSNIPERLLEAARALKAYGIQNGVQELTTPRFLINNELSEWHLALTASGLTEANGFYLGKQEHNTVVFLVEKHNYSIREEEDKQDLYASAYFDYFWKFTESFKVNDHYAAMKQYLAFTEFEYEERSGDIIVHLSEPYLKVSFHKNKTLKDIEYSS